jgi:hypothetical protein
MKIRSAFILLALVAARIAHAEGEAPQFSVRVPDAKDPKQKGMAPSLEVTVANQPKVTVDKYTLSATNKNVKVTLKAEKLKEYVEGTETMGIALVISGQKVWIGTDDYAADESLKYEGVLKNLEAAIDKLQLGTVFPVGSKGVVISYSTGADVKVAPTDLKSITGAALGNQKDYQTKLGTDLVSGITEGMAQLTKLTTTRKALIIIGDGNDTDPDKAKPLLADLKKQATKSGIQTFAIVYHGAASLDNVVIQTMVPGAKTVNSIDGIQAEMSAIVSKLTDRYSLVFPGYDVKTEQGLPWDGKEHDLVLKIDQTELEPVAVNLSPPWSPPSKGGTPWWVFVLIPVGAILLIAIGVKVFSSKPQPQVAMAPMPMPMAGPPMPGEPPKPAAPMKTVMIGVGGDQEGFPIVGWLVALNGPAAYQTYRLKPGMTKIGTAPPADMVVNDGFMSTEHCQIACAPAGFTLIDNTSTNGSYVNDKKVNKHELVDNDVITLGKTNFKFKSIN